MTHTSLLDAEIAQALKAVGQGRGDIPQTAQALIAAGSSAIVEMAKSDDLDVRNGLAMTFLYHRGEASDDDQIFPAAVVDGQFYPLMDSYAGDYPGEYGAMHVTLTIVHYALRSGQVSEAKVVRDIYRACVGFYDMERQIFSALDEAADVTPPAPAEPVAE